MLIWTPGSLELMVFVDSDQPAILRDLVATSSPDGTRLTVSIGRQFGPFTFDGIIGRPDVVPTVTVRGRGGHLLGSVKLTPSPHQTPAATAGPNPGLVPGLVPGLNPGPGAAQPRVAAPGRFAGSANA